MEREEIYERARAYIKEENNALFKKEVEDLIAAGNDAELEDRFYQSLEFGTGGLRGIIGGGTNRMNTYMINRATQGLANYFIKAFPERRRRALFRRSLPLTLATTQTCLRRLRRSFSRRMALRLTSLRPCAPPLSFPTLSAS